jgi:hypothetical protein
MAQQPLSFDTNEALYDFYTNSTIYLGIVVNDYFFGKGAIFHAEESKPTERVVQRGELNLTDKEREAIATLCYVYIAGYNDAVSRILSQYIAEQAKQQGTIIVPNELLN